MALEVGQRLGPYEIIAPVGAGGMGEVYQAKDTRLERTVAIKVLPTQTVLNADIRARFEREAKAISSLNHPNICTLYDIGRENGIDFLVMEYIEGESLADRLKSGALDNNESLNVAIQIADALDKAHHKGLIHRDLKPGNVMLTKQGAKLLDFGLAKLQIEGGSPNAAAITQTTPLTGAGTLLGTIQYMSPEQLEGTEADARSDIFAFGCVLYEMVTGQRAFSGKSNATLIAAIIGTEPPPVSEIKPMSAPGLNRVIKKCLAKDPDNRWQSARDLADELRWIQQSGSQAGIPAQLAAKRRFRFKLAWVVAAVALIAACTMSALYFLQPKPEKSVRKYTLGIEPGLNNGSWPVISPDGKYLAYVAVDSGNSNVICIRPMNTQRGYMLTDTRGALRPFWSPDSKWIGFTAASRVKKVAVAGGPAQLLGESDGAADGSWGSEGVIVFDGRLTDEIRAIPVNGGQVRKVTKLDTTKGETVHAWPQFLPDGKHFLYVVPSNETNTGLSRVLIGSLDSAEAAVEIMQSNSMVRYSEPGYLLYVRDNILFAQHFNANTLELTGEPIAITDGITQIGSAGGASFSSSDEGTLVIQKSDQRAESELRWYDRTGKLISTEGASGLYTDVALSPDEKRLAVMIMDPATDNADLWIRDMQRDVQTKLTFDEANEGMPVWMPDGKSLSYGLGTIPLVRAYLKPADGSGDAQPFIAQDSTINFSITDVTTDGQLVTATVFPPSKPYYIANYRVGSSEGLQTVVSSETSVAVFGKFSPDSRYIAYTGAESGRQEVYVRRSDGTGGKWQISTNGGDRQRWSRDGKELFYRQGRALMAVPVSTTGSFSAGTPTKLFDAPISTFGSGYVRYDVSADGQKFIIVSSASYAAPTSFEVTLNWTEELKEQ